MSYRGRDVLKLGSVRSWGRRDRKSYKIQVSIQQTSASVFGEDKFNNYLAMHITHVPLPMVNITTGVLHCADTICSKGQ